MAESPNNELPKARFWEAAELLRWEGFWIYPTLMAAAGDFRSSFQARNDDVLLASPMKTGTTWLKALCLSILHGGSGEDILAAGNPHSHVPTVECVAYLSETQAQKLQIDLLKDDGAPPSISRLLHTHLPYALLPDSVKNNNNNSGCKIVYISRNPKDTVISYWHFFNSCLRRNGDPFPLEKAVDCFCSGVIPYGPFFEHVAEYWRESQKRPDKVLFVKYEELKSEPKRQVSKIAEFLGRPLRDGGEVDEILWRCSLERLKNLEVNKSGSTFSTVPNSSFFRKGEVGDWRNYFSPEMEHKINQMCRHKLEPLGLFF